ncbi:MAG: ABC transporter substrate-binding protein [Thermodesulfobacteriota bacterium]
MGSLLMKSIGITVLLGLILFGIPKDAAKAAQELAQEQVVVLGLTAGDIGTVDPHGGMTVQDRFLHPHLFGSLVRYPIGECNSLEFQPNLATKWELSPDKLTWTFHLRKGVKWHWGYGELTAEDVIYSLNRVKNGKTSAFRGSYDNFEEFKAIDKYTVRITTAKPEPFLLTKVANYYGGFIVCKKAMEKAGAFDRGMAPVKEEAVGTGPFKFLEYKPKDRVILVRNDEYWGERFLIEKLVGKYIASDGARELALLKGEIAATVGQHDYKWLKHVMSKGVILERVGPIDLKALYFNLKMKPFDDKRVREAFAYAIGQDTILEMQGKEISGYCYSPVPTDCYGYVDAGWGKYKASDFEKAKKLLAEAGYPNGLTVKLFMSTGWWYLDKMVVYQNLLKKAGVNLDMTLVDHSAYKTKVTQGLNPIVIWGSRLPLATSWLRDMYHSTSSIGSLKAANNYMYYASPEVDRLTEFAETTFDEKARLDALAKAQKKIVEDLPAIPSIETYTPYVRNPWFDPGYEVKNDFLWSYEIGSKTKILKH